MTKRVLISACLVGWRCRYDGKAKLNYKLMSRAAKSEWSVVPFCPEVLGGLSVPREPSFIEGGDGDSVIKGKAGVIDAGGRDVTRAFIKGAEKTLKLAQKTHCEEVFLKEKSPSCGLKTLTDRSGKKRKGKGVTAALLSRNGLILHSKP